MNTTQAQQKALDDALVAPADRLKFEKCNMRLKTDIKPKEATFQVVLDALALTLFYRAFLITADVPAIYMQEFWATISVHRDLGHTGDITYLTDVNVDYLHQPWRAFATVINKCLSGKETGMDKIHLLFLIEYKDAKKTNKMSYPRFTKIIIDYFMSNDPSISRRNKMFLHTAQDDTLFTSMSCASRHEDTQRRLQNQSIFERKLIQTPPKKKPIQATKGTRLKSKAKVAKLDKKKQHVKKTKAKGDRVDTQSKVLDEQQQKTSSTDEGVDSEDEDDNDDDGDNDDDDDGESDDHDEDSDDERTESDSDEIPDLNLTNVDQTEYEEEDVDDRVCTPSDYKLTKDEKLDDEETMDDEEDDEQEEEDAHVTITSVLDAQKADKHVQSSSVSSDFTSKLLNLENPSPADNEITSLLETSAHHATAIPEITFCFTITTPLPTPFFNHLLQQQTPTTFTTTTSTNSTVTLPEIPNFASVFKFDQRVSALESEMAELKHTNQFAKVLSSIPGIVDTYLASKMKEAMDVAVQLQTNKLREEAQAKNQEFLNQVDSTMKKIIKDQVKAQVSKIMPKIEKSKEKKSSSTSKDASRSQHKSSSKSIHAEEPSHIVEDSGMQQDPEFIRGDNDKQPTNKEVTKADWFKKPERPPTPNPDWSKRQHVDFRPPQTWISQAACAEEPLTSFDEFNDTSFDFSAFVLNRLEIPNLTQKILVGPASNLLKGTCKSITELEYHFEECSKATTKRLDWHNPENKLYPFDLRKHLSLIQDHRGRQIIPKDYYIIKRSKEFEGLQASFMKSMTTDYLEEIEVRRDDQTSIVISKVFPTMAAARRGRVRFIAACSYSTDIHKDIMKAQGNNLSLVGTSAYYTYRGYASQAPMSNNIPTHNGFMHPSATTSNNYPFYTQSIYPLPNAPTYPNHGPTSLFADPTSCVTSFIRWIKDYPLPDGLKMPSHVGYYDGKGDPNNYLYLFKGAIHMQKWVMPVACHMFTYSLKDSARIWWNDQKARKQRIYGFVHGLKTRSLVEFLSTDLPTTYKGLMEKTYTWIEAKERLNDMKEANDRNTADFAKVKLLLKAFQHPTTTAIPPPPTCGFSAQTSPGFVTQPMLTDNYTAYTPPTNGIVFPTAPLVNPVAPPLAAYTSFLGLRFDSVFMGPIPPITQGIGFDRGWGQGNDFHLRKLKMPLFDGTDMFGWVYRAERFFDVQKVNASGESLEGPALVWFRWTDNRIPFRGWEELKRQLLHRFQPSQEGSLYEQSLNISQEGSAREYVALFEKRAA
ncbi:copia protein [Tanacetum coccineum]